MSKSPAFILVFGLLVLSFDNSEKGETLIGMWKKSAKTLRLAFSPTKINTCQFKDFCDLRN